MLTKKEFIEAIECSLKIAFRQSKNEGRIRPSILIENAEKIEFDLEECLSTWAKEKEINFAVVDISFLKDKDVERIPEMLNVPTVLMIKNFGDYENCSLFARNQSF